MYKHRVKRILSWQVLKMKDDELSPIDAALEQILDLLTDLNIPDARVRDFVRDAPLSAAVL